MNAVGREPFSVEGPLRARGKKYRWILDRDGRLIRSYATGSDTGQGIALWGGLTLATALVGGGIPSDAAAFYEALTRPDWAPPERLFGPVWTVLYLLMAWATVLVWRARTTHPAASAGLLLYAAALVPNAAWSWTFFVMQSAISSLFTIATLLGLLLATWVYFRQVRALSARLLLPAVAWVAFAAMLNLTLVLSNPGVF